MRAGTQVGTPAPLIPPVVPARSWQADSVAVLLLTAAGLLIGCSGFASSGLLWADAPQYANAAAMIHDWLLSGEWLHPFRFAQENYSRYPAFHLPYHPPAFPGLLGALFVFTGVSWGAARAFVAMCLAGAGISFFGILRQLGVSRPGATLASLVLMTAPLVAMWSRDTMSEVPGLAFILLATWFFLRWMERAENWWILIAAFACAEVAFLSRLLTAGVLPCWFGYALLSGKVKQLLRPVPIICATVYLGVNACWVHWVKQYARFETFSGETGPSANYGRIGDVLFYYGRELSGILGLALLAAAIVGCLLAGWQRSRFWLLWIAAYSAFAAAVGIYAEHRYFIYAVPGVVGLAAAGLTFPLNAESRRTRLVPVLLLAVLVAQATSLPQLPQGVRGYQAVAEAIAALPDGNVMVGATYQSDLIFRYRAAPGARPRTFLRADRTLAVRPPSYFEAPTNVVAESSSDVITLLRRSRARYIVSFTKPEGALPEVKLLHQTASTNPLFEALGHWALSENGRDLGHVWLWRYKGELPEGASEVPVVVPTADLTIQARP